MGKIRNLFLGMALSFILPVAVSCQTKTATPTKTENPDSTAAPELSEELKKREAYIAHLNEKYADYTEVPYGLDITKKTDVVSICYSTWFYAILGNRTTEPPNITKILAGEANWGKFGEFHYWAEPALGYYKSNDKEVIRTHMTQLAEAGVDFIIIDNTNVATSWFEGTGWKTYVDVPCRALLDTIVDMRSEGKKTPYVVFWSGTDAGTSWNVTERTYTEYVSKEKWKDCFVYWEGKPLMLTTHVMSTDVPVEATIRPMWGLSPNQTGLWSFLDVEAEPNFDTEGYVEQMNVCTASQETYMSMPTAHGRNHGIFMHTQWYNAFQYRPKVITLTWWNEWAAMRFEVNGETHFVDNYTQEYSRDLEPMKGGHGDQYYQWMKEYVRAYRALEECPVLVDAGYEEQAKSEAETIFAAVDSRFK